MRTARCLVWLTCLVVILFGLASAAFAQTAQVTTGGGPSIQEAQQEPALGPKARIAVARFTDKTGKGWWTGAIGDGMADMLATALFNTNRFIVLERQTLKDVLQEQDLAATGRIQPETAAPIGQLEGAELLVTGAVTEFEPGTRGAGGGFGGFGGGILGGILGGYREAHLAVDLRLVDTRTSRIVAATSVEGRAADWDLSGLLGGAGGGVGLAGALSGWSKTPLEKALRIALNKAVDFVGSQTPVQYYHFTSTAPPLQVAPPPAPAPQPSIAPPRRVEVIADTASVRGHPDEKAMLMATMRKGHTLEKLDQAGDWVKVRLPWGPEGWVHASQVKELALPPGPEPAQMKESQSEAPPAAPSLSKPSIEERLKKLKDLKAKGLITDEEYQRKREEILREL